jgi:outer membrane receptor protein involved in Fe transport
MEIPKMMRKKRRWFTRVGLCVLFAMVLILPAAGMAQDDNTDSEKEDASSVPTQADADTAEETPPVPTQTDTDAPEEADKAKDKADVPSKLYLDSMVVTATRTESKIKELPASVSVLGTQEMETVKFVDSRRELLKRVPGYSMIRNLRIPFGGKNYTINLVDGLATTSAFGSGSIGSPDKTNSFDIERIEVVKGPASALYGSHALGGVINVITRKPPEHPEYRIWGEGGMYDRGRGGVSAAGSTDVLGYFLDANILDYEGWQDRSANELKQASGKVLFNIGASSTFTVRGEYLDEFKENPGYLRVPSADELEFDDIDWKNAGVDDAYNDEQAMSLSAKYERDLSNQSGFELSYGIRNTESEGPPSYNPRAGFGSSDVTNQNVVGIYNLGFDFFRSELIVGIDLQHSASDSTTYDGRSVDEDIAQQWDIEAEVISPFLQYEVSPIERVRLSLGARYDSITYSATGYKISRGVRTDYDESTDFTNVSPKAGITVDLGFEQSLWLSYGQGFVVPSRTYLFTGSRGYAANPDLDPEKADNYEIGLRGQLMGSRLIYDITAYRTDITDMLVANDAIDLYVNAGEVRVQGVESAIGYAVSDRWRFDIAHTYADNKYIEFINGGDDEEDDYSGNTLSASPKHHYNARITWMPIQGFSAELEWNSISSYYTSSDNDDPQGEAERPDLFNLRLSYEKRPWRFWAHVLNLLDEKYAERVSYRASDNERSYTSGEPLNAYVGLSYTFN